MGRHVVDPVWELLAWFEPNREGPIKTLFLPAVFVCLLALACPDSRDRGTYGRYVFIGDAYWMRSGGRTATKNAQRTSCPSPVFYRLVNDSGLTGVVGFPG